jgi:Cthe_2314-like HEPN
MEFETLPQHPFFVEVSREAVQIQRDLDLNPLVEAENEPTLNELQFYITRVGYSLAHTLTWVDQLHQAVHFLSDFGYSRLKKGGIRRSQHLIYNVENYLVRLQSVYDRLLQLTNSVFHLCIAEGLINHSIIVSNLKVERTQVPKLLRAVRRTIKHKEDDRNDIVHRHSYADPELRRLELFYMHTEETWEPNERSIPYKNLCHVRSQRMKKIVAEKKVEFQSINASLVTALGPLFTEMHAQYKEEKTRLRYVV